MPEKRVAVIAGPYMSPLYRMIGAVTFTANTVEEAKRILSEITVREDIGIVFVAAEYYSRIDEDLLRAIQAKRPDLIVTILPTLREKGKPMDVQRELLKALGMG